MLLVLRAVELQAGCTGPSEAGAGLTGRDRLMAVGRLPGSEWLGEVLRVPGSGAVTVEAVVDLGQAVAAGETFGAERAREAFLPGVHPVVTRS